MVRDYERIYYSGRINLFPGFHRFLSNELTSPYGHFLVGLTVIFNKGLLGGDELVSNVFELLGLKNTLIKLLKFWDASPRGTPTLTILFLILTFCKLCSVFTELCHARDSVVHKSQSKDVIIENLDHDLGKLVKKMAKEKQNEHSKSATKTSNQGGYSASEISVLENSINNLSRISSEITESLYSFLSAFHVDQSDFPDSNEHSHFKSDGGTNKLQSHLNNKLNTCYGPASIFPHTIPAQYYSHDMVHHFHSTVSTVVGNSGQNMENNTQINSYVENMTTLQGQYPEMQPANFSGSSFAAPAQAVKNSTEPIGTNPNINDIFSQDDTSSGNINHDYERIQKTSTTYELSSNMYSSLI